MISRIFLIVLDSFGIGEMPDAAQFGDKGANTLRSIATSRAFHIDTLRQMGLGNIDGCEWLGKTENPTAALARLSELSQAKDTTAGHWEIAGLPSAKPFPTYPQGFPSEVIDAFEAATGRKVLCNLPYSGTKVIADYGREMVESGNLIVYTSADSVFQIAAHEDIVPREQLYEYCRIARDILQGEHSVGRVIARPFAGEYPNYVRTAGRHDFSLEPPSDTILDRLKQNYLDVIGIGKIHDIFAGRGLTATVYTQGNGEGMERTLQVAAQDFHGLCFVNLVDFDMLYGHRNDIDGYAAAISAFDRWLGHFITQMGSEDVLMITADHGCDPGYTATTDHTREYVPLLIYGDAIRPINLGTRHGFSDIAATVAKWMEIPDTGSGCSFAEEVTVP